ncbi:alanine racemase [Kangiella sp. TOML190]|uniref:alanine racemase n=1 Tax=Kangiella sp. TOML190 TaxID=2931351 RepID=UPI0020410BEB|nr:alanine racemase [Kangiella sp. TOML190]
MRPTKAVIDLAALRHNLERVKTIASDSKVMVVVKANAYGHGLVEVAKALPSADMFAVASLDEALILRQAGIRQDILLLEGFFQAKELPIIQRNQLQLVLHHQAQIEQLAAYQTITSDPNPIKVWLKCDSGMYRLGFALEQVAAAEKALSALSIIEQPIKLMSHFACADSDQEFSQAQISKFAEATQDLVGQRSMANSAGILTQPNAHWDWVRPGLLIYGASPMLDSMASDFGLQPVMSLESQLMAIKPIRQGQSVGYGRNWFAKTNGNIGLVAIGYGDGYPRHAKNGTPVWVNGRQVPLVGRVSMDILAVDLGADSADNIGDRVVLWGKELSMETVATFADTIPYTLCCGVTSRVPFEYINADDSHHD